MCRVPGRRVYVIPIYRDLRQSTCSLLYPIAIPRRVHPSLPPSLIKQTIASHVRRPTQETKNVTLARHGAGYPRAHIPAPDQTSLRQGETADAWVSALRRLRFVQVRLHRKGVYHVIILMGECLVLWTPPSRRVVKRLLIPRYRSRCQLVPMGVSRPVVGSVSIRTGRMANYYQ